MIAGRSQEQVDRMSGAPWDGESPVGVVDGPEVLPILGNPPSIVNDVAGDHHEIGTYTIGLVGD